MVTQETKPNSLISFLSDDFIESLEENEFMIEEINSKKN